MCAQIYLKIKANSLSKKFGVKIPEKLSSTEIDKMVHGYMKTELAPVIVYNEGKLHVKNMYFSLCPSWSKDFPCEWSTYNARMERPQEDKKTKKIKTQYIYETPTWREAFCKGQTCLVPISGAIESSYFGTHAGNILRFSEKHGEVFYALGIWSEWVDKKSGEIKESFALLTDDPYDFYFKAGHDRSIIVIDDAHFEKWLCDTKLKPKERFDFIRKSRVNCDWKVDIERPMKVGWEKRAPTKAEIGKIAVWK
ncbi:MAG: SOS response-associated peptidase family protein [Proteobacteria bacterium]|nr:SOS response-associated peptidase family protein [Pseudomonadota bacterium]